MAQIYRERDVRYTRDRSRSSSDDERHYKTVSHYKVGGPGGTTTRLERVERYEEDDDRHSRYSHSHVGRSPEIVEVDRRTEKTIYPDRPRSAFDAQSRASESFRGDGDRLRTVEYEREVERGRDYYLPERQSRTRVVEDTREVISPSRDHYWDRRHPWDDHETDVRLEKRVVRRDSDGDLKVKEKTLDIHKDKHHHHHDDPRDYKERDVKIERRYVEERDPRDEVERYRREVEYYSAPDPPQAPIVIRQKMPEQKVIVHEAPPPAPVFLPRNDPAVIVLRDEHREPRRDERRYERDSYDEDYYIKKTVIRRDRSSSSDHHKKRHIAEGALAGAGLGALVGSRKGKDGEHQDHKGRKVLAGAALGALGTEVIRRARSAYDDRRDEYEYDNYDRHRYRSRSRSRSRSKSRSRLATGLAIGAAALAVAGGLKYMQNNKIEKEESHRGRRRRRHSNGDYSLSRSSSRRGRTRSKSNVAKAGAATAALAGLVHHYRSKSRAEIAAAGLTGAAATKLWERHKDKKERENHETSDDDYYTRDRSMSKSRSRSRSLGRHHRPRDSTADRELGLVHVPDVEYGSEPLEPYESASEEPRRRRRHRHRSASSSDVEAQKKRSKSTLRNVATGLGTAAAAAIGIKKYNDHQKNKERGERSSERSSERSVGHSRSRDRSDRARDRRSRDRQRRRYEEAASGNIYYPGYDVEAPPPSPPHASGGFPPPPVNQAPTPVGPGGFTNHANQSTANLNTPYAPYNPQDYANLPPPPPGPPPASASYFPPPGGPGHHPGPENVSQVPNIGASQTHPDASRSATTKQDGVRVHFGPLSPESSRTLQQHREGTDATPLGLTDDGYFSRHRDSRRPRDAHQNTRSSSDPPSNRLALSHQDRRPRGVSPNSSDDNDVVDLPDRFDSSGRPLDPRDRTLRRPRSSYGEFEYRPRYPGDVSMRGRWAAFQIGEEDQGAAQLVQTVGSLLSRQHGVLGTLGHLLEDGLRR
ncbi:hypothetical protein GQX73_g5185 [Xylaria multiplex]|uniref:DUF3824 domain-containing protein n=1 Tax=Xylaria multiplex TaxID=323545 RepID=A0A7C8MR54_9PEZI|nr:hypothetical protein GQX73_g5185 [Xylaria multiplex]